MTNYSIEKSGPATLKVLLCLEGLNSQLLQVVVQVGEEEPFDEARETRIFFVI